MNELKGELRSKKIFWYVINWNTLIIAAYLVFLFSILFCHFLAPENAPQCKVRLQESTVSNSLWRDCSETFSADLKWFCVQNTRINSARRASELIQLRINSAIYLLVMTIRLTVHNSLHFALASHVTHFSSFLTHRQYKSFRNLFENNQLKQRHY